jgi:plasmid stabilization system protein ParE
MRYRLYRHPDVEQDLFDIADLIAQYAGLDIAERKLEEIEQKLDNLARLPHVGTLRHDIYPNLRAIPVARKGVITFVVDDAELSVFIVSITYADAYWLGRVHYREP